MRRQLPLRAPMLVMRGIKNDDVELRERMAAHALINGFATEEHFDMLIDMQGMMVLAGSVSRKWAYDYAKDVVGPVLVAIKIRYGRTKTLSATTKEKEVLKSFPTRYREFWLRQPTELYEAAAHALQEHYNQLREEKKNEHAQRSI